MNTIIKSIKRKTRSLGKQNKKLNDWEYNIDKEVRVYAEEQGIFGMVDRNNKPKKWIIITNV